MESNQYPFVAVLKNGTVTVGSGSLVTKQWVLTHSRSARLAVTVAFDIVNTNGGVTYNIDKIIYNQLEEVNGTRRHHPLALIRLGAEIRVTAGVAPITLANFNTEPGFPLRACGAGLALSKAAQPTLVQCATFFQLPTTACREKLTQQAKGDLYFENMECVSGARMLEQFCERDPGGPVFAGNMLVGFITTVYDTCPVKLVNFANVFVRIEPYLDWINYYINE